MIAGSENNYFQKNEMIVNEILYRCVFALITVGPVFAFARRLGLYDITYLECLFLSLLALGGGVAAKGLMHCKQHAYIAKYVLILGMHIGVCFVATKDSMNIYIAYAMMPALSCLYFKKRFTLQIMGMSYVIMMVSLYIRAFMEVEKHYQDWSQTEWYGAFGFALTWEYVLLAAILYALVGTIQDSFTMLHKNNQEMQRMQTQFVAGFANLLESRDRNTGHHIRRTGDYVRMIAEELRTNEYYRDLITEKTINDLAMAAPLHDVGKISIPDSILLKKGELTDEEYKLIQSHTTEGYRLVEENLMHLADPELYQNIKEVVLSHHERWDGSGYPGGLRKTEIPLGARIMAVADTLDALLSERSYKGKMEIDAALAIIESEKGTHFEPYIVDALFRLRDRIVEYVQNDEKNNRNV